MALSKGKKVLIAIVGALVATGAVIATVFAVKNVAMTDRPGFTTPVNPGKNEGQKPGQNEGQKPGQNEGQKPGEGDEGQDPGQGDEGQDPGQGDEGQQGGGDEGSGDETPEISEEEYYEKNLDLLKSALKEEYEKDNPGETFNLDDSSEILINEAAGEIYCLANTIGKYGDVRGIRFYVASFDNNILNKSQEEIYSYLNSTEKNYDLSFISQTRLKPNLSEEGYNEFSEYICNQKYESNGEIITFSEDAQVLDISRYIYDYDAHGNTYFQYFIIDNGKVYTARLENAMPPELSDWGIGQIMGYSNNVFKITAVKDFAEFGVDGAEQGGGEAEEGGYVLDLSEVPISKAEAASLAYDIWSLNPGKDMDIIFPANDSSLEM